LPWDGKILVFLIVSGTNVTAGLQEADVIASPKGVAIS
jgi:hypothetical protein